MRCLLDEILQKKSFSQLSQEIEMQWYVLRPKNIVIFDSLIVFKIIVVDIPSGGNLYACNKCLG